MYGIEKEVKLTEELLKQVVKQRQELEIQREQLKNITDILKEIKCKI